MTDRQQGRPSRARRNLCQRRRRLFDLLGSKAPGIGQRADRLEPLLDESDESIRAALVHLLDVPEKLNDRLRTGIDERLDNQRDLLLIGEFFGLPFQTVRIMSSNDQGDD